MEYIQKFWLEALCTLILSGLAFSVKYLWKKVKEEHKEQIAIKSGVLALAHDRIFQACKYFIGKGTIGLDELRNIEYLYNAYHDLGGNGTGTELYKRVKSLPLE